MILTLTPNPSIDTTLSIPHALKRGEVQRVTFTQSVAGGKGINVSQAVIRAGMESLAVFPAAKTDAFLELLGQASVPCEAIEVPLPVRVNTAITEPDGTTTKVNGEGARLDAEIMNRIEQTMLDHAEKADWVVLAGSLPPGAPVDWYSRLVQLLRARKPEIKIAVDTSDAPLVALGENFRTASPTLIKPNGLELGQLVGVDGLKLEEEATQGNFASVIEAARKAISLGVETVLVTLGGAGAVLVTADQAFKATPPPCVVASTVGAGDCTLAGFVMGQARGLDLRDSLKQGVAYGTAAASLPGTTIPTPEQINLADTSVEEVL